MAAPRELCRPGSECFLRPGRTCGAGSASFPPTKITIVRANLRALRKLPETPSHLRPPGGPAGGELPGPACPAAAAAAAPALPRCGGGGSAAPGLPRAQPASGGEQAAALDEGIPPSGGCSPARRLSGLPRIPPRRTPRRCGPAGFKSPVPSPGSCQLTGTSEEALRYEIEELKQKDLALDKEIAQLLSDGYSLEELEKHISLLHVYNDIKDAGQMLLGKLAVIRGVTTKQLYPEYDLELSD
ncbi:DNA repair protein SWI5 homolog [Calypte anna]|uniref:DNA repair protein SWI5 homolog n=1 Tax=Calypte anna TaxID=9244 RepID=UPI0011C3D9AD|nr:DNA repair protein SWI5 homolog [Calypte anna]